MSDKPNKLPGQSAQTPGEGTGQQAKPGSFVQVPKVEWDRVVSQLARLTAASDPRRLAAFDSKESTKKLQRYVKLSTYEVDGVRKVIVAWRMVKDDVFKSANGAWVENQIVEVIFSDDSKLEMSLVDFYRKTQQKISCLVKSRSTTESGEIFDLEAEDGQTYVVSGSFVN